MDVTRFCADGRACTYILKYSKKTFIGEEKTIFCRMLGLRCWRFSVRNVEP